MPNDIKHIGHFPCPCGQSKDNFSVSLTDEGNYHGYCFTAGCEKNWWADTQEELGVDIPSSKASKDVMSWQGKSQKVRWVQSPFRNISSDVIKFYDVKKGEPEQGGDPIYAFPFSDEQGKIVGAKYRYPQEGGGKTFVWKAKSPETKFGDTLLFGQHLFSSGGKYLTITEGEFDALAAYDMMGKKGPVVSLKNGASALNKTFGNPHIYEFVNSFEHIRICFDADEAGQTAALAVAQKFPPRKVTIFKHIKGYKDACDYLEGNKQHEFVKQWWSSEPYREEGIVSGSTLVDKVLNKEKITYEPYPWSGLNDYIYGLANRQLVTWTAETGVGKTQVFRELAHHYLKTTDRSIGMLSIEEVPEDSLEGLASVELSKPLHLPDTIYEKQELKSALDALTNGDRIHFYDCFGSNDIETIKSKIWFMAKGLGCSVIFLDHINMITSDQRHDDERKALDELATKFKQLTIDLDITLHMIAHTNREGQIRGTANIEKLSNIVLRLHRDKLDPDERMRNTTTIIVEKNRVSGRSGPCCWLEYDRETGRMREIDEPAQEEIEIG